MRGPALVLCLLLGALACPLLPRASAYDHEAVDAIRAQGLDAFAASALPGCSLHIDSSPRTLRFSYAYTYKEMKDGYIPSIDIEITFRDGLKPEPLLSFGPEGLGGLKPLTNYIGDEAILVDRSGAKLKSSNQCEVRVGNRSFCISSMDIPLGNLVLLARTLAVALPNLPLPASFQREFQNVVPPEPEAFDAEKLKKDEILFGKMQMAWQQNPPVLEGMKSDNSVVTVLEPVEIGFGYKLEWRALEGGYAFLCEKVLTRGRDVEAVSAWTRFPNEPAPLKDYRELFTPLFGNVARLPGDEAECFWNYAEAAAPLPAKFFHVILPDTPAAGEHPDHAVIDWLMTAFSDADFGPLSPNRTGWCLLTHLDARTCLYLLRSKNPATRLRAIVNLRRHAREWGVDLGGLAEDFKTVYQSVPTLTWSAGCLTDPVNARELVNAEVRGEEPDPYAKTAE